MPANLNYRYSRGAEKLIYDTQSKVLKTASGQFIKNVCCGLDKRWDELEPVEGSTIKRYCAACKKNVLDIQQFKGSQVQAIVQYDPEVCVYFTSQSPNIEIINSNNAERIIYTARTPESINQAVEEGYWPLIKDVVESFEVSQKLLLWQDPETGKIHISSDYRSGLEILDGCKIYSYRSCRFQYPFAAYLIPFDIQKGEKVYLDDVIEDLVGASLNQGDTYRLNKAFALWNGNDFEILHSKEERLQFVG